MNAHFCPFCRQTNDPAHAECSACGGQRPESGWPKDPLVGRVFAGKYRSESRLGAGGFGSVLLATQIHGDEDLGHVVLKVLHADLAHHDEIRRRFVNEARAARQLGSPHAVKVFDLAYDDDGVPFIVMEYLEGTSLADLLLSAERLPLERTLGIARQVAEALVECHDKGIVHRDLKPDNILLLGGRHEDFVKILDFGIAKVPSPTGPVTNTLMGTPLYMPPEQLLQQPVDHRVDIFALGVIVYECLTGSPPIEAASYTEYVIKNVQVPPRPLRELLPDAPAPLEALLARMMAKAAADRPADMTEVSAALASVASASTADGPARSANGLAPAGDGAPSGRALGARVDTATLEGEVFGTRRRTVVLAAGAVAVALAIALALLLWPKPEGSKSGASGAGRPEDPSPGAARSDTRAPPRPQAVKDAGPDAAPPVRITPLGADAGAPRPRAMAPAAWLPRRRRITVINALPVSPRRAMTPARPVPPEMARPMDDPFGRVR